MDVPVTRSFVYAKGITVPPEVGDDPFTDSEDEAAVRADYRITKRAY